MKADWCRLWHDLPTDPKWRTIARRSQRPITEVISVFIFMLANASNSEARGQLHAWDDEDVASALDMEIETVKAIREAMQGRVLDGDRLTGWERRQPKREDDGATERKRRQRAKDKEISQFDKRESPDMSRDVTHGHEMSRLEERREEIREEENLNGSDSSLNSEQSESDSAPKNRRAGKPGKSYAFEARFIRLTARDLESWQKAFPNLSVEAELWSLDNWAESQGKNWFHAVSGALAKKNREMAVRLETARTPLPPAGPPPASWRPGYGDATL